MPTASITDSIVLKIEIAAPPERVFKSLTDSTEIVQWFNNAECPVKVWKMDPRMGGRYSYETDQSKTVVVNGVDTFQCHGEIVEFDPPRLLAYTWISSWHVDKQKETVVRWELTPSPRGTVVKMTHSGLADEAKAREEYRGGWPSLLKNLKAFTERN
jgi:uncharacterized protein YndB with AHSA1/START domain